MPNNTARTNGERYDTCTDCGKTVHRSPASNPNGIRCLECRRANPSQEQPRECAHCGKTFKNRARSICGSCATKDTEAKRAQQGKLCRIPGCDRGVTTLTRMLCGSHAASDSRNKRRTQNTCAGCGETFTARENQSYCTIQCRNTTRDKRDYQRAQETIRSRQYPYQCRVCQEPHHGHRNQTVCDNPTCQSITRYGTDRCQVHIKTCTVCGQPFTTRHATKLRCSKTCDTAENIRKQGWSERPWRAHAQTVFKRDAWTCHLCGEPTLHQWDNTNKELSPSVDHIIPRSHGGTHELDNLATAHFGCNSRRSNKPILTR